MKSKAKEICRCGHELPVHAHEAVFDDGDIGGRVYLYCSTWPRNKNEWQMCLVCKRKCLDFRIDNLKMLERLGD